MDSPGSLLHFFLMLNNIWLIQKKYVMIKKKKFLLVTKSKQLGLVPLGVTYFRYGSFKIDILLLGISFFGSFYLC